MLTLIHNANSKDAQQDSMVAVVKPTQSVSVASNRAGVASGRGSEVGELNTSAKGEANQGNAVQGSALAQALRARSAETNALNAPSDVWNGLTTFKSERAIGSLAKNSQIQQRTVDGGVLTLIHNANSKDAQQDLMVAVVKPTQSVSVASNRAGVASGRGSEVGELNTSAKGEANQGNAVQGSALAQALRARSAETNALNAPSDVWNGLTTFKSERAIGSLAKNSQIQQRTVDGGVLTLIHNANSKDAQQEQDSMVAVVKPTQSVSVASNRAGVASGRGSEVGELNTSAKGEANQGNAVQGSALAQALRARSAETNALNAPSDVWNGLTTFKSERAIGSLAKNSQIQQRTVDGGV